MASEYTPGKTDDSMKGTGTMVNNMEMAFTGNPMVENDVEGGRRANVLLGSMKLTCDRFE